MSELKELPKAKDRFSKEIYSELLNMKTSKKLRDIISEISEFVRLEGKGITTSQLRNIYSKIKKEKDANSIQSLRPLLAYTSARQKGDGGKVIIALLDDLIQKISTQEQLASLKTLVENIVAYHKYYFPKSS